ncbi:hypothetical protein HMPREF0322_00378 [Desulfitobacterium hafniense DP7]|uniref:Uncharacterized protein n=1 Tax=Desulfitobacterium hafniense DP7 TaxID=537010 RepID=G9XHF3_DESHA|nr:hypothetical protein HMPREF0322_00378 [Desulfitobacterium hafniense DP7]
MKKKSRNFLQDKVSCGADGRNRTDDLLITSEGRRILNQSDES